MFKNTLLIPQGKLIVAEVMVRAVGRKHSPVNNPKSGAQMRLSLAFCTACQFRDVGAETE